jgi:hypothetical protein
MIPAVYVDELPSGRGVGRHCKRGCAMPLHLFTSKGLGNVALDEFRIECHVGFTTELQSSA